MITLLAQTELLRQTNMCLPFITTGYTNKDECQTKGDDHDVFLSVLEMRECVSIYIWKGDEGKQSD